MLKYQEIKGIDTYNKLISSIKYKFSNNYCYFTVAKNISALDNTMVYAGATLIYSQINIYNDDTIINFSVLYQHNPNNYEEGLSALRIADVIQLLYKGSLIALYTKNNKKDNEIYGYLNNIKMEEN
jgi:hypothetical protein